MGSKIQSNKSTWIRHWRSSLPWCVLYVSGSREERDKEKGSRDFLNTAKFVVSVQEDETVIVKEFILIKNDWEEYKMECVLEILDR